jgi:hypothetical protein
MLKETIRFLNDKYELSEPYDLNETSTLIPTSANMIGGTVFKNYTSGEYSAFDE